MIQYLSVNIRRFCFLTVLALFSLLSVHAQVLQEGNYIGMSDVYMSRNGSAELAFNMENRCDIVAVEFVLHMPDGFSVNTLSAVAASRAKGHSAIVKELGGGKYKFVLFSMSNSVIDGVSGAVMRVEISCNETVSDNEGYVMSITDAVMCDKDGNNVIDGSTTGTISIKSMPDLHVVSVECSAPVATKPMEVTWCVRNDGQGSTGDAVWNDYIWLVPNIAGGTSMPGAKLLATVENISVLAPGDSYRNTVNVVLDERIFGNYDLLVTSDMYDVNNVDFTPNKGEAPVPYLPDEASYGFFYGMTNASLVQLKENGEYGGKSDNFFYRRITIDVPPLPDLYVPSVVAVVDNNESFEGESGLPSPINSAGLASSSSFYSGKKVKVTATVENKGSKDIERTSISNVVYISSSDDMSGTTYRLAVKTIPITLKAGEKTVVEFSAQIPYIWFGDTYFIVDVDVNDAVYEMANTNNNMGASNRIQTLLTPGADFRPYKVTLPAKVLSGKPVELEYHVRNISAGDPFANAWTDYVYISKNPSGLTGDAKLVAKAGRKGSYEIASKTNNGYRFEYKGDEYSNKVSIPTEKIESGDYYFYVVVDANDDVFEYDGEENNVLRSDKVTVTNPDLTVELVSVGDTVVAGEVLPVSWTLKNIGNVDINNVNIRDCVNAVLNNGNVVSLGVCSNTVSIVAGGKKNLKANIRIPDEAEYDGTVKVFVVANYNVRIAESDYSNNASDTLKTEIVYNPKTVNGTDMRLLSASCVSSASPGSLLEVSSCVYNSGNTLLDDSYSMQYYLSRKKILDNEAVKCSVASASKYGAGFAPGDTLRNVAEVHIPFDIAGGEYFMHLVVNGDKVIAEKNYNNNTLCREIFIDGNFPDLLVEELDVPAEVMTSEPFDVSWKVTNCGYGARQNVKSSLYILPKGGRNKKELLLTKSVALMDENESLVFDEKILLEDNLWGECEIIVQIESYADYLELSKGDNAISSQLNVTQAMLPDLRVDSISCEGNWAGGSTVSVKAHVANCGECDTRKSAWNDAFYLAESYTLDVKNAIRLSSKTRQGGLEKGASYVMEAVVQLPVDLSGHYVLFAITDATDAMVERNEHNNMASCVVHAQDPSSRMCDLEVTHVAVPSHIVAGEKFTIEYKLSNNGEYCADGTLRDIIYLSKDRELGTDDEIVGVVNEEVEVNPGATVLRKVTGAITNVPQGDYYFIIRTNSAHTLPESDYDNNTFVPAMTSNLAYARIALNETRMFSTSGLYKLDVHEDIEGNAVEVVLDVPEGMFAGLYVSYEKVPTTASNEFSSCSYETRQQRVIIPNVKKGTYYLLAQDNSYFRKNVYEFVGEDVALANEVPEMALSCRKLNFGPVSIFPKIGGIDGWLTVNVDGALFDSIMDARMVMDEHVLFSERVSVHNSTKTIAGFNLNKAVAGSYNLVMSLPDGSESVLENCFEVVPGKSVELAVELNVPEGVRMGVNIPISVTYVNGGNTDIAIKELLLTSGTAVFAKTIEGLDEMKTELSIRPGLDDDDDGLVIIPPGKQNVINCYMRMTDTFTSVRVYIVR